MAFLAGKAASTTVGGSTIKFSEWMAELNADILDITNFESEGFKENITGLAHGKVTMKGGYDASAMALTVGQAYTVALDTGGGVTLEGSVRIENIKMTANVEKKIEVEVSGPFNGEFTVSIT